ncbi:MAG: flagellar basal body P-ring formation chaperone FlgA [Pseudomonadota bacterium]
MRTQISHRYGATRSVCLLAMALMAGGASATGWHDVDDIARVAEMRVKADRGSDTADIKTAADPIDANLRVKRCESPLKTRYPGLTTGPRVTVGVACDGPQRWQVFVSVRAISWQPVVVLQNNVPRGAVLTAEDLAVRRSDVSTMTLGYFKSIDAVVGRTMIRSMSQGQTLSPSAVSARRDIQKGQTVSLIASIGGAQIRMSGEALSDSAVGQRVRVKNLSSGRTVEGTVRKDGAVLIAP